jgi:hypothetical protein
MLPTRPRYQRALLLGLMVSYTTNAATSPSPTEIEANQTLSELYHTEQTKPISMPTRLEHISRQFLNQPYRGNALGEGPKARYDQGPLYRTDGFDCETYVDTILALAFAPDFNTFPQCINRIRYAKGKVSFITRNHFASLDWNKNNQKEGFTQDITTTLHDKNDRPVAKTANVVINKPGWYAKLPEGRIRLPNTTPEEHTKQLHALRKSGQHLPTQTVHTPYIPLTALFQTEGEPNQALFDQIPSGAIIEIIRPNWNLSDIIGSNLNVSHMGFAFRTKEGLRFRHASLHAHKVVDVSLIDYLENVRHSPTIRGINIQVVVPKAPSAELCHSIKPSDPTP